jgi:hypothetical protein
MARRRYFILDETLPEAEVENMMGRVVLDIRLPLRDYAPSRQNPQDIVSSILPEPNLSTNRKDFVSAMQSSGFRTKLGDYLGMHLGSTDEESLALESQAIRRYSLDQHKQHFTALMADATYHSEVTQLLKNSKTGKGYLVVGFMTVEGGVWTQGNNQERSAGVNATAPIVLATAGIPSLDPSINTSLSHQTTGSHSFKSAPLQIFAVAYDIVKLTHSFDKTVPRYIKTEPALGPAKRAKAHHLAMGKDSDEEIEIDEESGDGGEAHNRFLSDVVLEDVSPPIEGVEDEQLSFEIGEDWTEIQ